MNQVHVSAPMVRVCAWCRCVIGSDGAPTPHAYESRPGGPLVTHGICTTCRDKHFKLPARETCDHCRTPLVRDAAGCCMACGMAQLEEVRA